VSAAEVGNRLFFLTRISDSPLDCIIAFDCIYCVSVVPGIAGIPVVACIMCFARIHVVVFVQAASCVLNTADIPAIAGVFVVAGHCTVANVPAIAGVPQLLAYGWHPQARLGVAQSLLCRLCCYKTVDPGTPAPESGASHYCTFLNRAFDRMMIFLNCCLY
jgi:hypothetical protein